MENLVEQLEELDVLEAEEITIGNAFHAFRFNTITAEQGGSEASAS